MIALTGAPEPPDIPETPLRWLDRAVYDNRNRCDQGVPSVFGFALSVSNMLEAEAAVSACDGEPMSRDGARYLHRMNFPVRMVDYRMASGESTLRELELFSPEAHGSNMVSKNMIRWKA